MQKSLRKDGDELNWTEKQTPITDQWPTAVVVFGLAITPVWVGALLWLAFHWLPWSVWN